MSIAIEQGHLIGGAICKNGRSPLLSYESYSGDELWQGFHAGATEVEQAMQAAHAAWPLWSRLDFDERVQALARYQALLREHQEQLSELISRENGKPLWEAKTEAAAMIAKFDVTLRSWDARCADESREIGAAIGRTRHMSLGVCVVLGPFNLPGHLANGQIIPALLAGNTVVFKPSEFCPAVGALMTQLLAEVLPAGVVNLVHGDVETGKALLAHEHVAAVFFTGSYRGGVAIHKHFAGRPEIMLALEMGGNNPLLVWDAQDLEAAALLIVQSAYVTAGQRCVCARRLIIPDGTQGEAIIEALLAMIARVRIGNPLAEEQPFMSGVIHKAAADAVLAGQEELIANGALVHVRAQRLHEQFPTVLSPGLIDVSGMPVRDEEIFGPLLQVYRVANYDEAIAVANNTAYGLSAGLISDDEKLYQQFITQVRAGIINWNRQITGASGSMPFGGIGHSGNHRAGAWHAVDFCQYTCSSIELDQLSIDALPTGIRS